MAIQWSAGYEGLINRAKSPKIYRNMALAPVPGPVHRTHVHALAVALSKFAPHKKQALIWLRYLATVPAERIYANHGGLPSVGAVLDSPQYVKKHPEYRAIVSQVKKYGFSEPVTANTSAVLTIMATSLSAAWAGQESPSQALQQANAGIAPYAP